MSRAEGIRQLPASLPRPVEDGACDHPPGRAPTRSDPSRSA